MLDDQRSHIYDMVAITKQGHLVLFFLVCKVDLKVDTAETHFVIFYVPRTLFVSIEAGVTIHTGRGGDKGQCCSIDPDNEITRTALLGSCTIRA